MDIIMHITKSFAQKHTSMLQIILTKICQLAMDPITDDYLTVFKITKIAYVLQLTRKWTGQERYIPKLSCFGKKNKIHNVTCMIIYEMLP